VIPCKCGKLTMPREDLPPSHADGAMPWFCSPDCVDMAGPDEPCHKCGNVHPQFPPLTSAAALALGEGAMLIPMDMDGLLPRFGDPKTAWLRIPLVSGTPLSASYANSRWDEKRQRAHHRKCMRLALPNRFLDYVSCEHCSVALDAVDVFWKRLPK
jgi:hypothetical protein